MRIPLQNTPLLLKYYHRDRPDEVKGTLRPREAIHHDEFILCSQCRKESRFRLRIAEECRAFHDASAEVNWTCSDIPYEKMTCEDPEERRSRKVCHGWNLLDAVVACHVFVLAVACAGSKVAPVAHVSISSTTLRN